jgi:hypothetical protein
VADQLVETLQAQLDAVPRPPWPEDWACRDVDCGHPKDRHREPFVDDGSCREIGCKCWGWNPLTDAEWLTVYAAKRAGLVPHG